MFDLVYLCGTTSFFAILYFYLSHRLKNFEDQRLTDISDKEIHEAVDTDTPLGNPEATTRRRIERGFEERFGFLARALPVLMILAYALVVSIPYIGRVPSGYITIVAAIGSIVAGIALRPFLENVFSGVVISFFRAVRVGDTVIWNDHYGTVEEIGLINSVIKRWDWHRIVVPNSKFIANEIQNITLGDSYVWAYVEFFVAPSTNLEEVEQTAIRIAKTNPYNNQSEDPSFWVMDIKESSIKCWIAAWADTPGDGWELRSGIRKELLKYFQEQNIELHLTHHKVVPQVLQE